MLPKQPFIRRDGEKITKQKKNKKKILVQVVSQILPVGAYIVGETTFG